jgi:Barstar (barnase inhibitor)
MSMQFSATTPPWVALWVGTLSDFNNYLWSLESDQSSRIVIRNTRGRKMVNYAEMFSEISAALQFPHYFSDVFPSFSECLADLSWLPELPLILSIDEFSKLLKLESKGEAKFVINKIASICEEHASSEEYARPFHLILHVESKDISTALDALSGINFQKIN